MSLYQAILPQTTGDAAQARLHYLSADAYRLAGQYSRAESNLARARDLIDLPAAAGRSGEADAELREHLDLLGFQIAHDSGDCPAAVASLERFLETHPHSGFHSQARRTLAAIRRGDEMKCS